MKIKALTAFSTGTFSLVEDETIDVADEALARELVRAGFAEEVKKKAAKNESKRDK